MSARPLFVLAAALALLAAPVALAEDGSHEGPEPKCEPLDAEGTAFRCEVPSECQGHLYETPECTPPDFCHDNGDGTVTCKPPRDEGPHQEPPPDEHHNSTDGHHEGPAPGTYEEAPHHEDEGPPCYPAGGEPNKMICKPPQHCEGKLYQTDECTPPDFCEDNGDGTFTCWMPEHDGSHEGPGDDGHHGDGPAPDHREGEPDCRPVDGSDTTFVCTPPERCEGKLYQTDDCTPPDFCQDNGDGTFTCRMPEHERRAPPPEDHRPDMGADQAPLFHEEDRQDAFLRDEVRRLVEEALQDARDRMQDKLHALRAEYEAGTEDLRDRYELGRDELRAAYETCKSSAPTNASGTEARLHRLECIRDAREGLQELRASLVAEHHQLRQDLLEDGRQYRAEVCASLFDEVHTALGALGLTDSEHLFDRRAMGLCAEHLHEGPAPGVLP